jgi:hypothetical protein
MLGKMEALSHYKVTRMSPTSPPGFASLYHTSQFSSHWLKWAIKLGLLRFSHFAQIYSLEECVVERAGFAGRDEVRGRGCEGRTSWQYGEVR